MTDRGKALWGLTKLFGKGVGILAVGAVLVVGVGYAGFDVSGRVDDPEPFEGDDFTYIALGDSFSAGEGLLRYERTTRDISRGGNRCHRSQHAFGYLLGHELEPKDSFQFRACSGAVLENIFDVEQEHGSGGNVVKTGGPQLKAADNELEPDVVTITIGGNDAGFAKVVEFCFKQASCLDAQGFDEPDTDLEEMSTVRTFANRRLTQIPDLLQTKVYDKLADWYPGARIVVLGYPLLFPEVTSIAGQNRCRLHQRQFDEGERAGIRELGTRFNGLIAQKAIAAGLEYVEVADAFSGHETCGPDGGWLGFLAGDAEQLGELIDSAARLSASPNQFHPTQNGQSMYGRLVRCYLDEHAERPYVDDFAPPNADLADVSDGIAIGLEGDAVYDCATG